MPTALLPGAPSASPTIALGFGTYGMSDFPPERALRAIAAAGYDSAELCLLPGWPTEARLLQDSDRRALRAMCRSLGLSVPSLLEAIPLTGGADARLARMRRLEAAVRLSTDLFPDQPPTVQTVLGGRTAVWEGFRDEMVRELKAWTALSSQSRVPLAFKPHAGHAVHTPERALWLIDKVGSPWLKIAYDYSHFSLENAPLAESIRQTAGRTAIYAVKDSAGTPEKHEYLLPGDGSTDYIEYFTALRELGGRREVIVEVSSMIFRRPGYQALPTLQTCYRRLAAAIVRAGVARPKRGD